MQCLLLGLGILSYKVSDSESGLEIRDSGNSGVHTFEYPLTPPPKLRVTLIKSMAPNKDLSRIRCVAGFSKIVLWVFGSLAEWKKGLSG